MNIFDQKLETGYVEAMAATAFGAAPDCETFVTEATGTAKEVWSFRGESLAIAGPLLESYRKPAGHPEAMPANHPFRAAIAALETHTVLVKWGREPLAIPGLDYTGPFWRLLPPGKILMPAEMFPAAPAFICPDMMHAAALIVCGFAPLPQWFERPNAPAGIGFAGHSLTTPGLDWQTMLAAAKACQRSGGITDCSAVRIGDSPPGAHPWCFAVQALYHSGACRALRRAAAADPVIIYRGRGQRSALASVSVTEESFRDSTFRDALGRHLR